MDCKCKECKCGKLTTKDVIQQMDDQRRPYTEEVFASFGFDYEVVIRHFDPTAPEHLFKWHWDEEDRGIEALNENNWLFQFDNELPQILEPGKIVMIPKGAIHRLIKGTTPLSIRINLMPGNK